MQEKSSKPTAFQVIRKQFSDKTLLGGTSWMLLAEACSRASRLITIIVLAACLSTTEYGIAMLALVSHEMMRLMSRLGASAKLIQCERHELHSFAANCLSLNWLVAIVLAISQFLLAANIADYYEFPAIETLLKVMALSYLLYPIVAIKVAILQRNGEFKIIGQITAIAIASDNLSTAMFAILGAGLMSVAYAKVVAAIIWVIGFHFRTLPEATHIRANFQFAVIRKLVAFSVPVFGSELLKTFRTQVDVLLAGKMLSPEIFGLYAFAKSAGVGLAQSLGQAFSSVVYPHLAAAYRSSSVEKIKKTLVLPTMGICAIFLLQSLAAPVYVPLMFDNEFSTAGQLVGIMCLAAIPMLLIDIYALSLRVQLALKSELYLYACSIALSLTGILFLQPRTAMGFAAVSIVLCYAALLVVLGVFINEKIFRSRLTTDSRRAKPLV